MDSARAATNVGAPTTPDDGQEARSAPAGARPAAQELPLLVSHFVMLHEQSGIATDVIRERGYFSATSGQTLRALGFSHGQAKLLPALVLPVSPPDASNGLYTMRPDVPRLDAQGKPRRYELPPRAAMRLDCPPRCRPALGDPTIDLYMTEGQKKADALRRMGCARWRCSASGTLRAGTTSAASRCLRTSTISP